MADRGFLIEDLVRPYDICLNIPACTGGRSHLEPCEVTQCRVPNASRCQEHCASKLASSTTARQTSLILLSPLITELRLGYQQ